MSRDKKFSLRARDVPSLSSTSTNAVRFLH